MSLLQSGLLFHKHFTSLNLLFSELLQLLVGALLLLALLLRSVFRLKCLCFCHILLSKYLVFCLTRFRHGKRALFAPNTTNCYFNYFLLSLLFHTWQVYEILFHLLFLSSSFLFMHGFIGFAGGIG